MALSEQNASAIDAQEMKPVFPIKETFIAQIEDLWSTRETIDNERKDWKIKEGVFNQTLQRKDEVLRNTQKLCQEKADDYMKTQDQLIRSKKEVAELRTETRRMRESHLKLLQAEKDMDRAKCDEYERKLAAATNKAHAQQEEYLKLDKQLQSEREQSKSVSSTLDATIKNRDAQIEIQKSALMGLETQIIELKELINSQDERMVCKQAEVEELDKKILAQKSLLKDRLDQMLSHQANFERQTATHRTDTADWVERVRKLNDAVKDRDENISSQSVAIEDRERRISEFKSLIKSRDEQIISQKHNVDDYVQKIRERDEKILELEASKKKFEDKIDSQKNFIEEQKCYSVQMGVYLQSAESDLHVTREAIMSLARLAQGLPSRKSRPNESEGCHPQSRDQDSNTAGPAPIVVDSEHEDSGNESPPSVESRRYKSSASPGPLTQQPQLASPDKRRRSASTENSEADKELGIGKRRKTPTPKKVQSDMARGIFKFRVGGK